MTGEDDNKVGMTQIKWWNEVYASTDPTLAGKIGTVVAVVLPYTLYHKILPEPNMPNGGTQEERLDLLFSLQVLPALVVVFYIALTGLQRVPHSPAAAHDPANMYAACLMPPKVHAANRAFINTLQHYVLLWAASCGLALRLSLNELKMLPALYITWSVCRVMYIVGYIYFGGSGRMLGFLGTCLSSFAALVYTMYLTAQEKGLFY